MFYREKTDKCFKCIFLDPLNQDLLRTITFEATRIRLGKIKYLNIEKNTTVKVKRMYLDALVESKDYKINYEVNTTNNLYVHAKSMNYSCLTNKPKNSPTSSSSGMNLDLMILVF